MQTSETVRVLLNTPAKTGLFDYSIPPELSGQPKPGQMVIVPFNRGVYQAIVWSVGVTPEVKKILPIREILDPVPVLTDAQMRLAEMISERSLAPLHECANLLLTDKVRRISNQVYRLIKPDPAFQAALNIPVTGIAGEPSLPELFDQYQGELDETILNKTFGKNGWQAKMYPLIRSGMVQKSLRLDQPGKTPKFEPTAALRQDIPAFEEMNFSRIRAVNERRKSVLAYLKEHGLEVFQAELLGETGARRDDLTYLEKNGWITLQQREVWRSHQH